MTRHRLRSELLYLPIWCWLFVPHSAATAPSATPPAEVPGSTDENLNLLLVDVTLEGNQLADVINVYEYRGDVLIPVDELARLLTLGITVDRSTRVASGFIIKEDRPFRLDPASAEVTLPTGKEPYDKNAVRWVDGGLYVSSRLLERWWPIDFKLDMARLSLEVRPREKLPVQLRMGREKAASALQGRAAAYEDPHFPRLDNDYKLLSLPFVDNTLGISITKTGRKARSDIAYSSYATGDLLGLEAESYLSVSKSDPVPQVRLILSRNDPDGGLLGPLGATHVAMGDIGLPALKNVLRGGGFGRGFLLNNRPLNQPGNYGLQTLRGVLPQGWDVTLYFNDAVVAFAQARSDGLYEFQDLPLAFGRSEFRLVFHGPLGQTRVERYDYQLDQLLTQPGRLYYSVGAQRAKNGGIRQTAQVDFGLFKNVAANVGQVHVDNHDGSAAHNYIHAGLRMAALGSLINVAHTRDLQDGELTEVGLLTELFGVSVDANRMWLRDFQSEFHLPGTDPLRSLERLRLIGALGLGIRLKLPFALDLTRTVTASGLQTVNVAQRLSLNAFGTSLTHTIDWRRTGGIDSVGGAFQVSRWMAGMGISGQAIYTITPVGQLSSLALTADKSLGENNRLRLGVVRNFATNQNIATVGFNRNFGKFGVGISGLFGGPGNIGLGLQTFTALGRDPRSGRIFQDWRPMAGIGQVSAHVFVDGNQNNVYDEGEENVENAGFQINGGNRLQVKTDARGIALLNQLQTKAYADISLDQGTLEDPQWQAGKPGVRVLPRPGKVRMVDFPIVLTAEIDGSVYLVEQGKKRGIGNAQLELVDASDKVVGTTRSADDGYYIMPNIKPGRYRLRIKAQQTQALKLVADREADITINAKAEFVNGVDFTLRSDRFVSASALPKSTPQLSSVTAKSPSRKAWRVQLGAFSQIESAKRHWKELASHYSQLSSFQPVYINVNKVVRLQAGSTSSLKASRELCAAISVRASGCFPVSPEKGAFGRGITR